MHIYQGILTQPPVRGPLYNTDKGSGTSGLKGSALALFVFGILTDDHDVAFSLDNLTFITDRFY